MAPGVLPEAEPDWPAWRRRHTMPELTEAVTSALGSTLPAPPPQQEPKSRSDSSNRTLVFSEKTKKSDSLSPARSSTLSPTSNGRRESNRSEQETDPVYGLAGDEEHAAEPVGEPVTPRRILGPAFLTSRAWNLYWTQEVAGDTYLEAQLLIMTMATGVLDAMTNSTYHVFTSKQTGNTLDLARYAFGEQTSTDPLFKDNLGVAMGVFVIGAAFFGHIGHITHQRRRAWLLTSNLFQALLILAAAAVRFWASRTSTGPGAMAILTLLAFAESGQIATALNVNMPELNTTMITGALILLVTDRKFLELRNAKRNRRVAFFVSFFAGCVIGEASLKWWNPTGTLVVVAGIKCALVGTFLGNRGVVERREIGEDGSVRVSGTVTPASRVLWGD